MARVVTLAETSPRPTGRSAHAVPAPSAIPAAMVMHFMMFWVENPWRQLRLAPVEGGLPPLPSAPWSLTGGQGGKRSGDASQRRRARGTQRGRHEIRQCDRADQLIGGQTDFDIVTQKSQQDTDPVVAGGRLADPPLGTAEAARSHPHPVTFLEDWSDRRGHRGCGVLAQLGDGAVIKPWRRPTECDQSDDAGRAHDAAHLLGIAEAGKEIAGKKRFGDGVHAAGSAFAAESDARGEGLDLVAVRQIYRGEVFTATLGAEAEPAESAGIQQWSDDIHARPDRGRLDQRRVGDGRSGDHDVHHASDRA